MGGSPLLPSSGCGGADHATPPAAPTPSPSLDGWRAHPLSCLEGTDDGLRQGQRTASGAGVDRRFPTGEERRQHLVEIAVEGGVEVAIGVVEAAGLPHLAQLAAGSRE